MQTAESKPVVDTSKQPFKLLNNGVQMPALGLGTYSIDKAELVSDAITKYGYRLLDTASHYKNEEIIGEGLARAVE